jgi:hypothetical protein
VEAADQMGQWSFYEDAEKCAENKDVELILILNKQSADTN